MELKRVVVTGLGAVTPLGNTVSKYWKSLCEGVSGADLITHFDCSKFKTRFACEVKNFNIENFLDKKESRKLDPYCHYAVVAADEAIQDAGIKTANIDSDNIGVIWGSGIGGLQTFHNETINFALGRS